VAKLNPATGLWEDDENGPAPPQGGALGQQEAAPVQGPPVPAGIAPIQGPPAPPANINAQSSIPPMPQPAPPPAIPPVTPYQPQAMPVVPPSRVVSPSESETLRQMDTNTAARATTEQQAGQLDTAKKQKELAAAAAAEAEALKHQKEQQAIINAGAERTQALESKAQEDWDAYRQMGLKDPEAEQSFGHRVLAAIAIGLGEYASVKGGGTNRAAMLIKQANDQNIALQKANIDKAYRQAVQSGKDVEVAKASRDEQLRSLNLKDSALTASASAKLKTELARLGVPQAQIDTNKDVQTLEADVLQKREAINRQISQDGAARDKADLIAHARARKGGGGAGAGGKAEEKLDKEVGKRMDDYSKQAVGTARTLGPVRVLSQVEALRTGLDEAVASGDPARLKAATVKAMEQAGTLMSGGKLTNAQIAILHELESKQDAMDAAIGKWTGDPTTGKGLVKRLTYLIDDAGNELAKQVADIRQRGIDENLGPGGLAKTEEAKRIFMNRNRGLYGQAKWQGRPLFEEGGAAKRDGAGGDPIVDKARAIRDARQPAAAPEVTPEVIEKAKAEVKKNGPHAASAKRLLDQQGITVL